MIQVYSLNINRELNEREREQALNILTPERKAKALRFRRFMDQNRSLAAGLLEHYAIMSMLNSEHSETARAISRHKEQCVIEKGAEGKPYLRDYPDIQYNLSHSGDWVVCGIGNQPLGIDVERLDKYTERVVTRFFQQDEIDDIFAEEDMELRKGAFADYWVMKESFMKLSGAGFSIPLKSFYSNRRTGEIRMGQGIPADWKKVLTDMGISEQHPPVCQFLTLTPEYRCAVCTVGKVRVEQQTLTWEEVISIPHRIEESD